MTAPSLPANTSEDIADDESFTDSAYVESAITETSSIASWVYEFREENGRTYHSYKDGAYWGPNDEQGLMHLDLGHALYTKTYRGKLFLAPIVSNPQDILDLGTGTGIWCMDVADQYPLATVIGTDLSPVQSPFVPPNCEFQVDDMEAEWTWPENKFDFIHIRGLDGTIRDWSKLYQQCMKCLKPGGYLEQGEVAAGFSCDDGTMPTTGGGIARWNTIGNECHSKIGTELFMLDKMRQRFIDAGFQDVQEVRFKWPVGPWAKDKELKELGAWCRAHVDAGLENWVLRLLTAVLGWTVEEVHQLCANVRAELRDRRVHAIHRMNTVYGRKPL